MSDQYAWIVLQLEKKLQEIDEIAEDQLDWRKYGKLSNEELLDLMIDSMQKIKELSQVE